MAWAACSAGVKLPWPGSLPPPMKSDRTQFSKIFSQIQNPVLPSLIPNLDEFLFGLRHTHVPDFSPSKS